MPGASGEDTGMSCPPTCCFSSSQLAAVGHDGSEGRTRRPEGITTGASARTSVIRYDHTTERMGIDPTYLRNIRLFTLQITQDCVGNCQTSVITNLLSCGRLYPHLHQAWRSSVLTP